MTVQEIIDDLQYLISDECTDTQSDYVDTLKEAISVLQKSIPKKPLDICAPVVIWGICPCCKGKLNKFHGEVNRVFRTNAY